MDARTILARDGVADERLRGLVEASAFRAARPMRLIRPRAWMHAAPGPDAAGISELIYGEAFDVLIESDGFAFGQGRRDGYVGFVALDALGDDAGAPTHRVCTRSAPLFGRADIKTPEPQALPHNALVRVEGHEGRFAHVAGLGFLIDAHLAPIGVFGRDPAEVAQTYLGAPYFWGGRSSVGLDCSGLVQQALHACGWACPRDSDMQRDAFDAAPEDALSRGDLVFWPGHVAMLLDGATLIHANGFHMKTAIEPLAEAIARIGPPTAFRRP